jgi:hypothetical protein
MDLATLNRLFADDTPETGESPAPAPVVEAEPAGYWHGYTLPELLRLAPEDAAELRLSPALCEAFAWSLSLGQIRRRGERPPHYTRRAICQHCGPVWLFEGGRGYVLGCPWCVNRLEHLPIPRPPVTCRTCRHFVTNPSAPDVAIGTCNARPAPVEAGPSPRPDVQRGCGGWRPAEMSPPSPRVPTDRGHKTSI